MEDGELIQEWAPGQPVHVLVLEFQDPEDMIRTQERLTRELRGWTDQGERFDKVRTAAMTYGSIGRRELLAGRVVTFLLVTTDSDLKQTEAARHAWSHDHMLKGGLQLEKVTLANSFEPTSDQEDWFDRWADEAIEVVPAEGGWLPGAKTSAVRAGFNAYVTDFGSPEVAFVGSGGGRALSALLRRRFGDSVKRATNDSGNPYVLGLRRKGGAKKSWYPNTSERHV